MQRRTWGYLLTLASLATGGAFAQGLDPNREDTRLDRKIRLAAEGLSVGELLARISKGSGIKFLPSREAQDDKVILFSPARPLRDALNDLAALFGNSWQKEKDEQGELYRMSRRRRAQEREEELATATQRQTLKQAETQLRALNDRQSPLSPNERAATQLFALLSAAQREKLFEQGFVALPMQNLTPEQRAFALRAMQGQGQIRTQNQTLQQPVPGGLPLTAPPRPNVAPPNSLLFRFRSDATHADLGLLQPPATITSVTLPENTLLWRGNPYEEESKRDNAPLPDADIVQSALQHGDWIQRLRTLSEQANVPVLADYYRGAFAEPTQADSMESPPIAQLNRLAWSAGYSWRMHGSTLLFRKRDWFWRKQFEVPDRWLAEMERRLRNRQGQPAYEDLFRFATLTRKQEEGLMALSNAVGLAGRGLGGEAPPEIGWKEALALLAERPAPNVRNSASIPREGGDASAGTLTFADMTGYQRGLIPPFLNARGVTLTPDELQKFQIQVGVGEPIEAARGFRYLPARIRWSAGTHQGALTLIMPLSLPDDRRAKTRIEFAP